MDSAPTPRGPLHAVVFDYGGVLSTAPFAGFANIEASLGYPPGSLSRLFFGGEPGTDVENEGSRDWATLETGGMTLPEFYGRLAARAPDVLGRDLDADALLRELQRNSSVGVHWEMVHAVRRARERGLRTALCTNNVHEWRAFWQANIPMDIFDDVVDSCEVGMRKPDPAIYLLTCERIGVAPEAAAFLDDPETNVEAARRLGMHGILVGPDPRPALDALTAAIDGTGE